MALDPMNELKLALAQVGVSPELVTKVAEFADDVHALVQNVSNAARAQEVASLVQTATGLAGLDFPGSDVLISTLLERVRDLLSDEEKEDPEVVPPPPSA